MPEEVIEGQDNLNKGSSISDDVNAMRKSLVLKSDPSEIEEQPKKETLAEKEEKESKENKLEKQVGEEEESSPKTEVKFDFKSQEEAEKAYKELRKLNDRQITEKVKQINDLETKVAAHEKRPERKIELTKKIISELQKLDSEDPEYNTKAWAVILGTTEDLVSSVLEERFNARIEADKTQKEQAKEGEKYVKAELKKEGLDDYFDDFIELIPAIPKNLTGEDMVKWGIDRIKRFQEKILESKDKQEKEKDEKKKDTTVLGKGGKTPEAKPAPQKPSSLSDAIAEARKRMVIQ